MSRDLRLVNLVRGEAIFDVEKDATRPLRVVSGNVAVQAVGTRFVVYRQPQRTVVTVVEGRVLVSPAGRAESSSRTNTDAVRTGAEARPGAGGAAGGQVGLDAGQRVTIATDGTVAEPATADVDSATSWTRGRLVFDAETLDTVVAELNRYSTQRLVIADAALGRRRITGVFKLDDPDAFLALLADLDDIRVERSGDGERLVRIDRARDRKVDTAASAPGPP
jgi:transmembrane sensor